MAATAPVPTPTVQTQSATMAASLIRVTPPSTPQIATAAVGAVVGVGGFSNSSLYVGDLEATVDESKLYDLFNQVVPVVSVRVCRDQAHRTSLGYAYVNFGTPQEASHAREILNFTPVNGKPIRIMFSHRDPCLRKTGHANVFIKNLDDSIDNKALYDTFAVFGTVLSCKVAVDNNGCSKGYGFVQFDQEEAAQNAIRQLNGMLINDKQVYVGTFVRRQERNGLDGSPIFTNVYVKNLSETVMDEDLKKTFGKFGPITSAVVMKDTNGNSRCFGFVNYESPEAAASAVENLNGSLLDDKALFVGKAEKKVEREAKLRAKFEHERISRYEKLKDTNLYLKNLDDGMNDEKLKELFSEFGTITSCKVMLDQNGVSKGAGFVAFSTPEEAMKALNEMNGKMIGRKPLYAAVAQRKEERKAWLQVHFAQMRTPVGMLPLPGMPGFHLGAPRLAPQQLYFGQVGPVMPPQAAGYGFQQQHMPGVRTDPPNFIMPFQRQRQGQPGQHMGPRRGGNAQYQQQQVQRNLNQGFSRYMINGRNGMDPPIVPQGSMANMTLDVSAVPATSSGIQHSGPVSRSTLASALASASPENQQMMLGEQLYPLVEHLERNHAGKVTGMLLEMDQTEVLHLIESPDALRMKVGEAMNVLQSAASGSDIGNNLGSLS
ncbi:Polyadenylate-binding protein 5 [Forsythia ovata]|uniref:Polyadenylate-binding protein n=1 Tax=Forsythia ovata TaxID=205694 RepID=A0ABD1NX74_9LAMI